MRNTLSSLFHLYCFTDINTQGHSTWRTPLLLENRVCFAMYSATNAMVRQYRPRLQVYDLTYPQFIVLLALYEQDNVTLTEIGQKTFFDSGTLTPIIKKLEEKQFLKRVAVKEDERMKKVVLLEKHS